MGANYCALDTIACDAGLFLWQQKSAPVSLTLDYLVQSQSAKVLASTNITILCMHEIIK